MALYCIADLHLDTPTHKNARFEQWCTAIQNDCEHLYILGDLFEAWIGDDAMVSWHQQIAQMLATMSYAISLQHGNRDFLLGQQFVALAGAQLLGDVYYRQASSQAQALLMLHGDTLCTDDVQYQQLRQRLRSQQWQETFLQKSVDARAQEALDLRKRSKQAVQEKSPAIMDVNAAACAALFAQYPSVNLMVHGHTHRPFVHIYPADKHRIVVGDWREAGFYFARVDAHDCTLHYQAWHEVD